MGIAVVFAVVFSIIGTVLSARFLRAEVANWPEPGEKASRLDTIRCVVWMQTVLTWGVVLAAFMWRSVSVLALLVWSLLVSYFLGKYFGRLLTNHKEKLSDELWRHKRARQKIDAAYKAKTVDALRYCAESGCEQDYARSMLDRLLEELNGPIPHQERLGGA